MSFHAPHAPFKVESQNLPTCQTNPTKALSHVPHQWSLLINTQSNPRVATTESIPLFGTIRHAHALSFSLTSTHTHIHTRPNPKHSLLPSLNPPPFLLSLSLASPNLSFLSPNPNPNPLLHSQTQPSYPSKPLTLISPSNS